ncbi:hypothetical protein TCAL_14208 [Tigriopus californicus]|uniref:Saposin B-type domain-containing protein n=1 Tax=Tigriopus californicus TaxID=6832 RepID=A0A553NSS7_TIGCA|nr:prosaposin-like [Tigriopus californicus]TRY68463.1 hypothetical protein TCAL_14208 [Tigriopus californicus]
MAVPHHSNMKALSQARIDVFCDVCQVLIQDLDNFITDDTTEEDILGFLENICVPLGIIGLEDICRNFIEEYGPQIIDQLVNENLSPSLLCGPQGLGICDA